MTVQHNLKEQAVATLEMLPEEYLQEIARFLDYLRYKMKLKSPHGRERRRQQTFVPPPAMAQESGWPPAFFEQTFGCLRDEPLVREAQGEYEIRGELQ